MDCDNVRRETAFVSNAWMNVGLLYLLLPLLHGRLTNNQHHQRRNHQVGDRGPRNPPNPEQSEERHRPHQPGGNHANHHHRIPDMITAINLDRLSLILLSPDLSGQAIQ
ncbi:uncharacterized protein N7483_005422 [Penicillium malachiteum]|uniref:uncharacterized protein n=1 Tax=Penicillium malachiteum TaxID=1324776 RepID=UPI00254811E4|nr:uncharacterized protein N7483_005422 [Penicillium malachiteum]KAJ5730914.1 hypothetical protein N7483_005422 [Penicillium malachiteum]